MVGATSYRRGDKFDVSYAIANKALQCWAVMKNELKTWGVVTDKQLGGNEIQVWKYTQNVKY